MALLKKIDSEDNKYSLPVIKKSEYKSTGRKSLGQKTQFYGSL